MKNLVSRVILGVAAGVAVYLGFSIWAGAHDVQEALSTFSWGAALGAFALAAGNYALRFVRWQFYLRVLRLNVPIGHSLLVFLSGFALTVTPGKVGEAIKALLLRQTQGIPAVRTAPIVLAERATDLLALLLLALVGLFTFDLDALIKRLLLVGAVLVVVALLAVSIQPVATWALGLLARLPGLGRFIPKLHEFYAATAELLRPYPLLAGTALSVASWFLECLAFWVVVRGFPAATLGLQPATFIYATMTVAGALSFLPGGLGVTEAGMLTLLGRLGTGISRSGALAATFVTRLATLWFAVAIGLGALALFTRQTKVDLATLKRGEGTRQSP